MGQQITPTALPDAQFVTMNPGLVDQPNRQVSNAASIVVSPDKTTMLVLTSGYNRVYRTDGDKTWPNISMSPVGVWSAPQTAANTLDLGHPFDPRDKTQSRQGNGLLYNAAPQPNSAITAVNAQVAVKPCGAGHRRRRC